METRRKSAPTEGAGHKIDRTITDDHLKRLLQGQPIYLNLAGEKITDEGLTFLQSHATQLTQLNLIGCQGITSEGMAIVSCFPKLEILFMDGHLLTDAVVESLKLCPNLRRLHLAGQASATGRIVASLQHVLSKRVRK